MPFKLTPPTQFTLLISVGLAILAVVLMVLRHLGFELPVVGNQPFATLLVGYLVLLAGNLFEGI
jgi:ABC-type uncharacterized transport system permease subunit